MIVQRRGIEMLCGRQLFHLLAPKREENAAFLPDERCQFIKVIDGFSMRFGAGFSKARPAFSSAPFVTLPESRNRGQENILVKESGLVSESRCASLVRIEWPR